MTPAWHQSPPWNTLLPALRAIGLNTVGVAAPDATARAWGARSAVVFGSGGPALWNAFVAAIRADASVLTAHPHPLDRFIADTLARLDPSPAGREWVRCAFDAERFVDFRPLAEAAGLGTASRTGLLLHPEHGLWMGLRAVCFTDAVLPPTGPVTGPGPCATCAAPCAEACPGSAVSADQSFDIQACIQVKSAGDCAHHCAARNACPEGVSSRYPRLEQQYHEHRASGRRALAAHLGIVGDAIEGEGPYWSEWAE